MTGVEKLVNNVWVIGTARAAMFLTPIVASTLVYLGTGWLGERFDRISQSMSDIRGRIVAVETASSLGSRQIQDHESRLLSSAVSREEYQITIKEKLKDFDKTLDVITDKLVSLDGSVIKLGTIINERVPKPASKLSENAQN